MVQNPAKGRNRPCPEKHHPPNNHSSLKRREEMSDEGLPFGWGTRHNQMHPDAAVKDERAGDWRQFTIPMKYATEVANDGYPVGWSNRHNTKSLEELATSSSASVVAVAEVHLKPSDTAPISFIAPGAKIKASSGASQTSAPAPAPSPAPAPAPLQPEPESEPEPQSQPLLMMLSAAVLKMDSRIQGLEANVATLLRQQERILQMLEKQQREH